MQLHCSVPDEIIKGIDHCVDGIRFRNRTQLIITILKDWIDRKANEKQDERIKILEAEIKKLVKKLETATWIESKYPDI